MLLDNRNKTDNLILKLLIEITFTIYLRTNLITIVNHILQRKLKLSNTFPELRLVKFNLALKNNNELI